MRSEDKLPSSSGPAVREQLESPSECAARGSHLCIEASEFGAGADAEARRRRRVHPLFRSPARRSALASLGLPFDVVADLFLAGESECAVHLDGSAAGRSWPGEHRVAWMHGTDKPPMARSGQLTFRTHGTGFHVHRSGDCVAMRGRWDPHSCIDAQGE